MARMGRPPLGAKLVDRLDGDATAKKRLRVLLQTLTGETSVLEAAELIGCNESRVHQLRTHMLEQALAALKPQKGGRRPKQEDPKDKEIKELRSELERAQQALRSLEARLQLAVAGVRPLQKKRRAPRR